MSGLISKEEKNTFSASCKECTRDSASSCRTGIESATTMPPQRRSISAERRRATTPTRNSAPSYPSSSCSSPAFSRLSSVAVTLQPRGGFSTGTDRIVTPARTSAPSSPSSSCSSPDASQSSQMAAVGHPRVALSIGSWKTTTPRRNSAPSSPSSSCSSPDASQSSPLAAKPQPRRAVSVERKRITNITRTSLASSPSSRSSTSSSSSPRCSTPVQDTIAGAKSFLKYGSSFHSSNVLRSSIRSLPSSFQSESFLQSVNKKDVLARNSSSDMTAKVSAGMACSRKSPLRRRITSNQSENSTSLEASHTKVLDQRPWPGIVGKKLSGVSLTKSVDLDANIERLSCLPGPVKGLTKVKLPFPVGADKQSGDTHRLRSSDETRNLVHQSNFPLDASVHRSDRTSTKMHPSRRHLSPISTARRPLSPIKSSSMPLAIAREAQTLSRTRPSSPIISCRRRTYSEDPYPVVDSSADLSNEASSGGKKEDAHQLRLLQNRALQWHIINILAEGALLLQESTAKHVLYNAWTINSKLNESVITRKIEVQLLSEEMKIASILNEQVHYLEEWASLEKEHSKCLSGAIRLLKTRSLHVPLMKGARADARDLRAAVSSALDVMQAMASSINYLLQRVQDTKSVIYELSCLLLKEIIMLDECRELLVLVESLQVKECSLNAHLMQLRQHFCEMG